MKNNFFASCCLVVFVIGCIVFEIVEGHFEDKGNIPIIKLIIAFVLFFIYILTVKYFAGYFGIEYQSMS